MTVVLLRTLRDLRRGLIGWTLGVVSLVAVMAWVWPSMQDIPDLDALLANYPEPMRELFNIDGFSTGAGFFNAELFSLVVPILFAIFGISRGARLLAGQEEAGHLEVTLAQPVPRWRVLAGHALALAAAMTVLGTALLASLAVANVVVDVGLGFADMTAASVSMVLFGIEFGLIALAVGAATGRRGLAMAVASVAAIAAYLLYALSKLVDPLDGWEVISPVQHALRDGPLGTGWSPGSLLAMAAVALSVTLLAMPLLHRRDIHG
ncbi:ABC transporter permease subunit [Euzebya pacifica]|uniref:ABC transporter permease subunit n=1 Tax=Euzebya pacifica TaxID=1608957 RepID=UPI0030F7DB41